MAKRKRSTRRRRNPTATKKNPPRRKSRRRRSYRRNPGIPSISQILKRLQEGVINGGLVLVGEAGARSIPTLAKLPATGAIGILTQAGVAIALGIAGDQFLSKEMSKFITAGAISEPMRQFIKGANVPFLSTALSGYYDSGLSGYYELPPGRDLSALPGIDWDDPDYDEVTGSEASYVN